MVQTGAKPFQKCLKNKPKTDPVPMVIAILHKIHSHYGGSYISVVKKNVFSSVHLSSGVMGILIKKSNRMRIYQTGNVDILVLNFSKCSVSSALS